MKAFLFLLSFVLVFCACQKQEADFLLDARDGHQYSIVKIGSQWWMAENLAYLPIVSELSDTNGIWVYGYSGRDVDHAKTTDNYLAFGCLYSWTHAMDIQDKYFNQFVRISDSLHQGICPEGWHLPSDSEWQNLEDLLDTDPSFTPIDERQHTGDVGKKIKATITWTDAGENNETGFGALATGFRYRTGYFFKKGQYAYFWTSTEHYTNSAIYRYLWDESPGTFRGFPSKSNGMSVRCVKDY